MGLIAFPPSSGASSPELAGPARGRRAPAREAPPGGPAVATAGRAARPGRPVRKAAVVQHGLPGRGPLPAGWAPGVGSLAAWCACPGLPRVLLGGTGPLPAAWRPRRWRRWPDRRAHPVPVLHARGHDVLVGHGGPAVRAARRPAGYRPVRDSRGHAVPGCFRDLRRAGTVPAGARRMAGRPVRRRPVVDAGIFPGQHRRGPRRSRRGEIRDGPVHARGRRGRRRGGLAQAWEAAPGWRPA